MIFIVYVVTVMHPSRCAHHQSRPMPIVHFMFLACVRASALINFISIVAYKIDVILVVDDPTRAIYHLLNHTYSNANRKKKQFQNNDGIMELQTITIKNK